MEARVIAGSVIVLVGFMGAGKSTGARALAAELGVEALDSDRELEQRLGEPIESFFDREGEAAFRAREEEVVLELLAPAERSVVALGGGAVHRSACARRWPGTRSYTWRSNRATPGGAPPATAAPWPATRSASRSSTVTGWPVYELVADAVVPPGERDGLRRALPVLKAPCATAPPGTQADLGLSAGSATTRSILGRGLVEAASCRRGPGGAS